MESFCCSLHHPTVVCKSSYITALKARKSLGFYPKSYSGFGSSRSCAPPLVDDSVLSPEELGSSPARIEQLSRSHGGKVDSGVGTRKRKSPGRPYLREGEECKSSYITAPKARNSLGFYPKSYIVSECMVRGSTLYTDGINGRPDHFRGPQRVTRRQGGPHVCGSGHSGSQRIRSKGSCGCCRAMRRTARASGASTCRGMWWTLRRRRSRPI